MHTPSRYGCDVVATERVRDTVQVLACLVAVSMALVGCSSAGVQVSFPLPPPPSTGPYLHVANVIDARRFTADSRSPSVQSVLGEPNDTALSERVVGRQLSSGGSPGDNVLLEPPQSVRALVERAVLAGLRAAGYRALADRPPITGPSVDLHVTVGEFWIHERSAPGGGALDYRARIILSGSLVPLRGGRIVEVNGSVLDAGEDDSPWKRAVESCLEAIGRELSGSLSVLKPR